ncbi:phospholipase D family protein [Bacillus sp. T3]|uniref:phospholipase D family protein n=1 Tax=Bacillus sp. T3 TaxID=467262 RepID=UPI0029812BFA|nr:phospholipase D family protein [Bacillus sp. T3]
MKTVNLIHELNEPGYKVSLFTSYSIDLVFFEKMIMRHLIEQNCTYVGLVVDQNCLQESIQKPNIKELGTHYMVKGVETNQAFHPKMYLLLGEKKAKLMIGSGNLTPAGFITNHEVFNVFTYNEEELDTEHLAIIQAAYHLFYSLHHEQDQKLWKLIFQKLAGFHYLFQLTNSNGLVHILHNHTRSLQEQLAGILPTNIRLIECFSPYFDRSLSVLNTWENAFIDSEIKVFLQNGTTNFPKHFLQSTRFSIYEAVFHKDWDKRYHGKVFRFVGDEEEVIVYGSANCSRQAFLQTFKDAGNSEAIVVEKAARGTFESFFSQSIQIKQLIPDSFSVLEEDETNETSLIPVRFVEGIYENKCLTVKVKTNEYIERFSLNGIEGHVKAIVAQVWTYEFKDCTPSSIVEFVAFINGESLILSGWVHHIELLQQHFENVKKLPYESLKEDPYLEDYQNIVSLLEDLHYRLVLTEEDMEEKKTGFKTSSAVHQHIEISESNVTEISVNLEDYYVDESLEEIKYGSVGGVDVLGSLIHSILSQFNKVGATTLEVSSEQSPHQGSGELTHDLKEKLLRRMYRFTKKLHQGITSSAFLEKISPDAFVRNLTIYCGFLLKVYYKLGNEFYSKNEIVEELCKVVKALEEYTEHQTLDIQIEEVQYLLVLALSSIVAKDLLLKDDENYQQVRAEKAKLGLHLKLIHQRMHPIRESYTEYTDLIQQQLQILQLQVTNEDIEKTIEERFPILTHNQFVERLKKFEGVSEDNLPSVNEPKLTCDRIVRLNNDLNLMQLSLLSSMLSVDEWEDHTSFYLIWRNTDQSSNLKRFVLYYNQKKSILRKKFVYRNGLEPRKEEKVNVTKTNLLSAASKGAVSILADGFKGIRDK